jgi:hypothetical protein
VFLIQRIKVEHEQVHKPYTKKSSPNLLDSNPHENIYYKQVARSFFRRFRTSSLRTGLDINFITI